MASMTITIPDEFLPDLVDALCARYGWRSVQEDGAKSDFAKAQIKTMLKEVYAAHQAEQTVATVQATIAAAETAARTESDTIEVT